MINEQSSKHIHISAAHRWLDWKIADVWQYRDLIWLFAKRPFTVRYKQTILGPAWLFLHPLITALMYTFVFGGIAGIDTDGVPRILFYLSGTALWTFFSSALTENAQVFSANADIFGKVYFPRLTKPIANVLSAAMEFGIQLLMITCFLICYIITGDVHPHWWSFLLLPVVLLHLGLLAMGCGLVVSGMTAKYRDLRILIGFGMSLWMYVTPVVYPLSLLDDGWVKRILLLNPVTQPMEVFRWILLGNGTVEWFYLGLSWAFTIAVTLVGTFIFNRVERTFMDTV